MAAYTVILVLFTLLVLCLSAPSVYGQDACENAKHPLIILPGIMASQINASFSGLAAASPCVTKRSMQTIWPPTAKHILPTGLSCWLYMVQPSFNSRTRRFNNKLGVKVVVEPGGPSGTEYGLWQSSYSNLTSYLAANYGYTLGKDMFGAPFDWRLHLTGLERSGHMRSLAARIAAAVVANCGKKAVLIGHSMGGLVSLSLLHRDPQWTRQYIEGFISVSTPYGGTTDQAIAVRMGSVDFNINDWVKMPMARAAAEVKANHSTDVAVAVAADIQADIAAGMEDTLLPGDGVISVDPDDEVISVASKSNRREGRYTVPVSSLSARMAGTNKDAPSTKAATGDKVGISSTWFGKRNNNTSNSNSNSNSNANSKSGRKGNKPGSRLSGKWSTQAPAGSSNTTTSSADTASVSTATLPSFNIQKFLATYNVDKLISNYISGIFYRATLGLPGLSMLLPYAQAYGNNRRIIVTERETYTASMMQQLMEDIGDSVTGGAWRQVHELDNLLAKGSVPGVPTYCLYAIGKDTTLTWKFPNIRQNRPLLTSVPLVTTGGDGTVTMQSLKQCYRITDTANITELGDYGHLEVLKHPDPLAQLGLVLEQIIGKPATTATADPPAAELEQLEQEADAPDLVADTDDAHLTPPSQAPEQPVAAEPEVTTEPVNSATPINAEPVAATEPVNTATPINAEPVAPTEPVNSATPTNAEPVAATEHVNTATPINAEPVAATEPVNTATPINAEPVAATEPVNTATPINASMPDEAEAPPEASAPAVQPADPAQEAPASNAEALKPVESVVEAISPVGVLAPAQPSQSSDDTAAVEEEYLLGGMSRAAAAWHPSVRWDAPLPGGMGQVSVISDEYDVSVDGEYN